MNISNSTMQLQWSKGPFAVLLMRTTHSEKKHVMPPGHASCPTAFGIRHDPKSDAARVNGCQPVLVSRQMPHQHVHTLKMTRHASRSPSSSTTTFLSSRQSPHS